ncbi:MAG TPA: winged helix-turn-helix transcriptional regulator [Stackebrandtia sp.]|uniref:helix-turn-helix transcriptional regulator n=1 Tax=Stackebrandtia sp. TaxID=2023065 RepID=UPI002D264E0F|nr:winged helix-turn-helix transcriptional regulator [Stackebrandtia sp.]HZE37704.1 winged helix-turn-helix transcriptional regulator [Stackebrandtia sp.]
MENVATRQPNGCSTPDGQTRQRVAQLLLENPNSTARDLAASLNITPVAVRKHLDAMTAEGLVTTREPDNTPGRGRGRPARTYLLTEAARDTFDHHYDDLATQALRWIQRHGGPGEVSAFAAEQVTLLENRCRDAMDAADDTPMARATALAEALSHEGYAASTSVIAGGGQLCQHHCPVSHVAAQFPQLCEAETAVISRLVGHHVQRLATIANGDGVCTTYIPGPGAGARTLPIIDNNDR